MRSIVILVVIFSVFTSTLTQDCEALLAKRHDCEFYRSCLEKKFNCGRDGYPIGYGYKYCTRFLEQYDEFSSDAQQWIDDTLICLKQALADLYRSGKDSCERLYDIAFGSHPRCYVQNGFCSILARHPFAFPADLMKVYDIADFMQTAAISQVKDTIKQCLNPFRRTSSLLLKNKRNSNRFRYIQDNDDYTN